MMDFYISWQHMLPEQLVRNKYTKFAQSLNERCKRLWAASEALALGPGGVKMLHQITGLSPSTIYLGIKELEKGLLEENNERIRQKGKRREKYIRMRFMNNKDYEL
jgi:hypothetical protein